MVAVVLGNGVGERGCFERGEEGGGSDGVNEKGCFELMCLLFLGTLARKLIHPSTHPPISIHTHTYIHIHIC